MPSKRRQTTVATGDEPEDSNGTGVMESRSRSAKLAERRQQKLARKYPDENPNLNDAVADILCIQPPQKRSNPDQQNLVAEPVKNSQKSPDKR